MLTENNDAKLISLHVDPKCVPFYQQWKELFDPRTLDIYQYRVLTSLSALAEMQLVIEKTLSGLFNSDANIEACREELLYLLNHDPILEKHYKALLNRMRSVLGKKISTNADKNKILHHVHYAITVLCPDYLKYALSELKDSLLAGDIRAVAQYANIVASHAISIGWSAKALVDLSRHFVKDASFDDQWKYFERELLNEDLPEYCVFINIPFRNQKVEDVQSTIITLKSLGLEIQTRDEIVGAFSDIKDIERMIHAQKKYIRVVVKSKDVYAAAHLAITKISEQLNVASFYNLVGAWDLQSVVIVSINLLNKYYKSFPAKTLYSTYDYIDSSSRVFEATKRVFSNGDATVREKLQGSFGYTNISRASLFQEEKYMNLWVALESLARTNMYSDIISNIKETVPAAICLRYIYRVVRNFVEDCKRCQISLEFSTCVVDADQGSKQKMVREMITVFKDDTLYKELQSKCKVNSLLYNRTDDIRLLLTDVAFAKAKIENHYMHIHWQIQRLYRIRNEITHAALREQTSLIVYIEHLYHYLSAYISEIVTCLADKNLTTIEEALCLIKDNYDVFIAMANSGDAIDIQNDVFKTGIINLIYTKP